MNVNDDKIVNVVDYMKNVFADLIKFIGTLSVNDIIFFTSVMGLLILGVTMIYLVKLGRLEKEEPEEDTIDFTNELMTELESVDNDDVLPKALDEPDTLIDLATITKNLEKQKFDIASDLYEKEQEEKAIISYDELIKTNSNLKINYQEETETDGLTVKKVDLDNLTSVDENMEIKSSNITLVSYEKEEAFLKALKELQNLLS